MTEIKSLQPSLLPLSGLAVADDTSVAARKKAVLPVRAQKSFAAKRSQKSPAPRAITLLALPTALPHFLHCLGTGAALTRPWEREAIPQW